VFEIKVQRKVFDFYRVEVIGDWNTNYMNRDFINFSSFNKHRVSQNYVNT